MKWFLPVIAWSLFILIVSWNVKGINLPSSILDLVSTDKAAHATVYFVLSWLSFRAIDKNHMWSNRAVILVVIGCSAYGFLMEILQYHFFTGRHFEYFDIVANIIGVFAGLIIYFYVLRKPKYKTTR